MLARPFDFAQKQAPAGALARDDIRNDFGEY